MTLFRSLLYDLIIYPLIPIMGILLLPAALHSKAGAYWAVKLYVRIALRLLALICGLRTEVRGTVPTDPVLIAAKHQSFLDILILVDALPEPRFIMKRQLRFVPIFGFYAERIGSTPVSRGRKGQAVRAMMADVQAARDTPGQLVIYPQGTRTLPGAVLPYKVGAGVIYTRMGLTCVPAATNVGVFWSRRSWLHKPGLGVVEFLDPIPPGKALEPFMEALESRIETASNALHEEAGFRLPKTAPAPE
ncbi:MAG: lysophospholipid acyltransferase family protein [Pseudomonadota bacterium]